jgi:BNR repeat protein
MRLRLIGVALACAFVFGATAASAAAPSFTSPVRLGFLAGDDWEPAIAADRFGHVYALWTHYGGDSLCEGCASPHMELQVSSDGGTTWSIPGPLTPGTQLRQDDPQIVVDPADGRTLYAAYMLGDKASQYVAKSTDFGQTWTNVLVESLQRGTDKDILAVRGQDVYLVYNAVQKIWASVSHDGGQTWTLNHVIGNTNSKFGWSLPGGGAVDSKGNAYFAWEGFTANGKPSGEVNLFVTKSTDGGQTWTSHLVDVSQAPPQCGTCGWAYWGPQTTLAVDGRGRVYVLYNANRVKFGVNRMLFARSTDGALTWDRRQDVSGAPIGSNNLFPAVVARATGDVRIAWQDDRNGFDTGNDDPNARWNTYYRSTADGGANWSAEAQLSQFDARYGYKSATPSGYAEPYGDYFELDIDGAGVTHALWGEGFSYNGPGNVWYARGQ